MIVESPTKTAKLNEILGDNYLVLSCCGHVMDLDKRSMSINFDGNKFEPIYTILSDKTDIVNKLKNACNKSSDVILATDKDREGEIIAWCLMKILNLTNPKRIVFTSITKKDILDAMKSPTQINNDMVNAQKMRRMLDRIIGYKLTPLLWKSMGSMHYSTGRVQSVAVRFVIDQENKIKHFFEQDEISFFKIHGEFNVDDIVLNSQLCNSSNDKCNDEQTNNSDNEYDDCNEEHNGKIAKISKKKEVEKNMEKMIKSKFIIGDLTENKSIRQPSPPFTTASLQQEASRKYGFSLRRTASASQHLYENGFITYIRTDSVNLSDEALNQIGNYITKKYGKEYHRRLNYVSKGKFNQEAHEAIRPTDIYTLNISENIKHKISSDEIKLYSLIWKRTVASQMLPAEFMVYNIKINISKIDKYHFESNIEQNIFMGYLMVYDLQNIKQTVLLPQKNSVLNVNYIEAKQDFNRPPSRYNDASLANELKKKGIGRPSTLPSIIEKIQTTNYIKKDDVDGVKKDSSIIRWNGNETTLSYDTKQLIIGKEQGKFIPTHSGFMVTNFLMTNFNDIMQYDFTAEIEDKLDEIENGKVDLTKLLLEFWNKFNPLVLELDSKLKTNEIVDNNSREVGIHPTTGVKIIATIAKYGPVIKMTETLTSKKLIYGPIKPPLNIDNITLEDALKIFEFPKNLGKYKNKIVNLNKGKFGYYLTIGKEKVALSITEDEVFDFTLDDAIISIDEKANSYLWYHETETSKYEILNGQFGNYIKVTTKKNNKSNNYRVPKNVQLDYSKLTLEEVYGFIKSAFDRKKRFFASRKK